MPENKKNLPDIPVCRTLIMTAFYRSIPVREKEKWIWSDFTWSNSGQNFCQQLLPRIAIAHR